MCPPGHASSRDPFTGRHTGRPLRIRLKYQLPPKQRAGTEPRPYRSIAVLSGGPMYLRHGFRRPNFVPKFGASVIGIGPYERRGSPIDRPGQWRRAERLRRGWEEGVGIAAEIISKYPATSDNPSVALRATAPFAQGSLALRGTGERADTRVRPYVVIGVPSNPRRGGTEPAPYGSTGSADLRADVPKAWLPPTIFRSEIWGVGHRHRPLRKDGERIPSSPAGPQPPIPRDSGMVSKGRAAALPLVVSRRGWGEIRNSPDFFLGIPLDRQRALARWPHRARRARHFPASRRGRGLPDSQRKPKPLFPAKTPGNRLTGVFGCGII